MKNETLYVYHYAWRYLFDADDLQKLFPIILCETDHGKKQINIAFDNAACVKDILEIMEEIMDKKAKKFVEKGSRYEFDNSPFVSILEKHKIVIDKNNYNYSVLKKHLLS